jgi:acid phosphatase family membrane protein YuiD
MIKEMLYRDIFLVPILCGFMIQILKIALYSFAEKRVAAEKFIQPYGLPNLHSAVFGSISTVVGIKYGFSSILFSFVATYSVIIIHDTMRLKGEKGKQVDLINRLLLRIDSNADLSGHGTLRVIQLRPFDVLSGTMLGVLCSLLVL